MQQQTPHAPMVPEQWPSHGPEPQEASPEHSFVEKSPPQERSSISFPCLATPSTMFYAEEVVKARKESEAARQALEDARRKQVEYHRR